MGLGPEAALISFYTHYIVLLCSCPTLCCLFFLSALPASSDFLPQQAEASPAVTKGGAQSVQSAFVLDRDAEYLITNLQAESFSSTLHVAGWAGRTLLHHISVSFCK